MAARPRHRLRRTGHTVLKWFMSGTPAPLLAAAAAATSLSDCPACGAPYVHPVDWEARDGRSWWIHLRCGACERHREVVVGDAEASAYDEALGLQAAAIERAVAEMDRERMAGQLETFIAAL